MPDSDDISLLKRYADGDESAFAELVERYVDLVYSTALRQAHNPSHAEEITQAVFIVLTRKAGSIRPGTVLSGWLYHTARLTALNFQRSEIRRQHREQEAYMESLLNEPASNVWPQIAPLLDAAMGHLNEKDRNLIVLRFFQNRSSAEISDVLGIDPATVRKRLSRAVEQLRRFFIKRNIAHPVDVITGAIASNSVHVAPVGLAKAVTTVALAKGVVTSTSTLTLVKGALKVMAWSKTKTVIAGGIVLLLVAGTTTIGIKKHRAYQAALDSWRIPRFAPDTVSTALPQIRILPTKFKPPVYGQFWSPPSKWAGVRVRVTDMVRAAYNWPPGRIYFQAGEPAGRYDFATTLPEDADIALQNEIKKTFGLVGHTETMDTDVWVLKVRTPDASGLKPHVQGPVSVHYDIRGHIICMGVPLSSMPPMPSVGLTKYLEIFLQKPVIDETDLSDIYDIDLKWNENGALDPDHHALNRVLLDQLGMELVLTNRSVEMLVMEKAP